MDARPPSPERLREVLAGRYRLDARIGAGGMATIYRARDLTLDRDVAVKVLHPHLVDDEALRERFRTEARHAARLLHPNIVNVFDTGDRDGPDGLPWIVMEYVDGPSLRDVLRERGRLSPREALAVVEPIARGLARAHDGGVVHRDVKPENVLIAPDGTPKVADFGIARALAETSHTQTGMLIGSVHYMAPELVSGKPATVATDQYGIGVLLYELLTGRQPLPAESPMAVALRHAQELIPAPSAANPEVPPALDRLVARATAPRPEDRYPDLLELASALRAAVPDGPVPVVVHTRDDDGREHTLIIPAVGAETTVVPPAPDGEPGGRAKRAVSRRRPAGPAERAGRAARTRRGRRVPLAVLLVLALGLAATGVWAFVLAPPVTVPDVRDMTLAEAADALEAEGLALAEAEPVHSRDVPQGMVAAQEPEAGGRARKGGQVRVALSRGPLMVTMPSVLGLTRDEALDKLAEHGFDVQVDEGWHDAAPKGTIAGQSPEPGETVAEGRDVSVYLSQGIEQVTVPDLSGMDRDEAAEALEQHKLAASFIEIYSDDVPEAGAVISQSVQAGQVVDKDTTVEVHVSKGPLTVTLPSVEGRPIDEGRAALQRLDLKVVVIEQARPRVGPFKRGDYGRVEAQDPSGGTKVKRGDTVRLWTFSKSADEQASDDD